MVSITGMQTGEHCVIEAQTDRTGYRRRVQIDKTLDGGVTCIDYGEDIAGEEIRIMADENDMEGSRALERIARENVEVEIATEAGLFRGVARQAANGEMTVILQERRA
ncbi:MAG: hypothetical protein AB1457_16305 [Chloroflexota bacterium]